MAVILGRKSFGAILRVFSKTPDQVEKNVTQVLEAANAAAALTLNDRQIFSKILILVASDPAYPDVDCGETMGALRKTLPGFGKIEVHAIEKGDPFCTALNYGNSRLLRHGVDFSLILSHGAKAYLREDTMMQLIGALEAGAKVTGIAIDELSQSILEGRIANTFAIWDLVSLMSVGGFDLRASQPHKSDPTALYLRGWSKEKGDVYYPRAGVEEIIPLIRLVRTYGPCIAPVVPAGAAQWKEPDKATDPEGYARSQNKLGTKLQRQMAHAASENADLSSIQGGVMEQYRTF